MNNGNGEYSLGFALNFNIEYNCYVPQSYIVECENNTLKHAAKQVNKSTLDALNFKNLPREMEDLLQLCNDYSREILLKKFKISKQKTFEDILNDKILNIPFKKYCLDKLKIFLDKIYELKAPLTYDFKREEWFNKNQLTYSDFLLEPDLIFEKREDKSVFYILELFKNDVKIIPTVKNTKIFAPELNYIIIDSILYKLHGINSNKIKPFLEKKQVEIPAKNVNIYFEKFVKDVSNQVNIQAKGFDFQIHDEILKCKIEIFDHFITQKYFVQLKFDYQNISFSYSDKKSAFSKIDLDGKQEVFVQKTIRDKEREGKFVKKLNSFGFEYNEFNFFELKKAKNKTTLIDFLISNYNKFLEKGISLELEIEGKKITSNIPIYHLNSEQKNDWFDIKIIIECGEFKFPFTKLINNLKKNDKFYALPDGNYFIIPDEWFSKFERFISKAEVKDDLLKLPKSNFTLLENISPKKLEFEVKNNLPLNLNLLKAKLRPYQLKGVEWLDYHCINNFGACLADDMGLGKTIQIIALLVHYKSLLPKEEVASFTLFDSDESKHKPLKALIVLPSSLVFNWAQEFLKFAPHLSVLQYTGIDRKQLKFYFNNYDVVLTTYGLIANELENLQKANFDFLILDESHRIKNINSLIFKNINQLNIPKKITLSGTPIENSLSELWAQMQFINPNILGTHKYFKENFLEPITKKSNTEVLENLKSIINPFILRRTKESVAPELPNKIEQIHYCEMLNEQKNLYNSELSKARNYALNIDNNSNKLYVFNLLLLLRQISNHPKLIEENYESGKEIEVQSHLETLVKSNQKVLIFSSFVKHLEIYTKWCDANNYKYCLLTGSTPVLERGKIVNKFIENEDISLFFISKKAGGEGLNLTVANYVVLLDPWWNPFVELQAIARSHRIGQDKNVMVTRFITKDSIEEKILKLQEYKQDIFDLLIPENTVPNVIIENLNSILEEIK